MKAVDIGRLGRCCRISNDTGTGRDSPSESLWGCDLAPEPSETT